MAVRLRIIMCLLFLIIYLVEHYTITEALLYYIHYVFFLYVFGAQ